MFSDHRSLIRGLTASALVASNDMMSSGGPSAGEGVKQGRRVRGTGASGGHNRGGAHSAALLAPKWQQQQHTFPPPPPLPAPRSGGRPGSGSGGKKGRNSSGGGGGASVDFNHHLLRAVEAAVAADAERLAKVVEPGSNTIMQ